MPYKFLAFIFMLAVTASAEPVATQPDPQTNQAPNISMLARPGFNAAQKGEFELASSLYEKTAKAGDNDSRWLLAGLYLSGKVRDGSKVRARELLETAAAEGHPAASFDLGSLFQAGAFDGKPDIEKARFYYQQSAEAGHARGQFFIGNLTMEEGASQDDKAALEWYQKAAAQNLPEAKFALVQFYDTGRAGVGVDTIRATALCLEAATAGSTLAMNDMGIRYQRGTGITRDDVAAIGWFSLAGQFNLAAGHINLGSCFETGRGCKQDLNIAGSHYAAASKLNHPVGQFMLGRFFEEGKGTEKNPAHAYVLYSYAAAQNHAEAITRRDELKKKLSKEQIAEAEKMLKANSAP